MEISLNNKIYKVIEHPYPHILVDSKKEIHGWFYSKNSGRRECTSERLLINPYNGCSFNCFFCYARTFTIRRFESGNEENYEKFIIYLMSKFLNLKYIVNVNNHTNNHQK